MGETTDRFGVYREAGDPTGEYRGEPRQRREVPASGHDEDSDHFRDMWDDRHGLAPDAAERAMRDAKPERDPLDDSRIERKPLETFLVPRPQHEMEPDWRDGEPPQPPEGPYEQMERAAREARYLSEQADVRADELEADDWAELETDYPLLKDPDTIRNADARMAATAFQDEFEQTVLDRAIEAEARGDTWANKEPVTAYDLLHDPDFYREVMEEDFPQVVKAERPPEGDDIFLQLHAKEVAKRRLGHNDR
jgi:hypothetical protein